MNENLESLLVSGSEIDKKLVNEILQPYLRIDRDTHAIRPLEPWDNLTSRIKILAFLVARKAMMALQLITEEAVSSTEIQKEVGLLKNTVNPTLKGLRDGKFVAQTDDRKYFIPNTSMIKVKNIFGDVSTKNNE